MSPPLLTSIGLVSLAVGGLSGWLVLITVTQPQWLEARGVTRPRAFLQTHLDWILMGLLLIAVDVAVPTRPAWITAAIALGTIVNPLLFLPLAWGYGATKNPAYKALTIVSFTALSGGLVALAIYALA